LEKRREQRRKSLLAGIIVLGKNFQFFPCTIRSLSPDGASLRLGDQQITGEAFYLLEVARGLAYEAKLIWRNRQDLGVALSLPIDLRTDVHPRFEPLRRIWLSTTHGTSDA
jgi:hypothetical protein